MFSAGPAEHTAGNVLHFGSGPFPLPEFLLRRMEGTDVRCASTIVSALGGPKQLYEIIVESVLSPGGLVKKAGRISMEQAKMQKRIF